MKKSFYFLMLLLVFNIKLLYCQNWISNKVTDFFKQRSTECLRITNDYLWICEIGNIYRINNDNITIFSLDSNSSGSIYNFKIDTGWTIPSYETIVSNNKDVLWLVSERYGNTFIKIKNDSVFNYKNEVIEGVYNNNFYVDEEGQLWLIRNYMKKTELINQILIKIDIRGEFHTVKTEFLSPKDELMSFFIYNDEKYFIIRKYNNNCEIFYDILIIQDKFDKIISEHQINGPSQGTLEYKYFCDKDDFYILASDGKLITKNKIIRTTLIDIWGGCFWFIIYNHDIYYTHWQGFKKYNIKEQQLSILDTEQEIFGHGYRFRNLILNGNLIYGNYGGWDGPYGGCEAVSNGIGIFEILE